MTILALSITDRQRRQTMTGTVLITGANGRLGRAAVAAFAQRGWNVNTLVRQPTKPADGQPNTSAQQTSSITEFVGDASDVKSLLAAATGCDVILPAANPSYELWASVVPATTDALITAAASVGATIVLPGNIYAYGDTMPTLINAHTPHQPNCEHGEIRSTMEKRLKAAAREQGVQTLVVRAGGYMDGHDTGNWFETYMCKDLNKNQFMYPGSNDAKCTWAYLPDVADIMVRVAEMREQLEPFDDIGFPGYSVTGSELHKLVENTVGSSLKLTGLPWFVIKVMSWFRPAMTGVYNMRYLFYVSHAIDGTRLKEILPDWKGTPIEAALPTMLASLAGRENELPAQSEECLSR